MTNEARIRHTRRITKLAYYNPRIPLFSKIVVFSKFQFLHDLHLNEKPADEDLTEEHLEDDSNPIIFTIRNAKVANLSQSNDRMTSSKEEIWFEKPSEIPYESDSNENENTRENLKRKTTILRKMNPIECNYKRIGNQNLFLQWGIFAENFPDEILKNLHNDNTTEAIVNIRRSHIYRDVDYYDEEARMGIGYMPLHLVDFHNVPDSMYRGYK